LEKRDGRIQAVEPVLRQAENKEVIIIVSAFAIAETIRIKGVADADQADTIFRFFLNPYIEVRGVDLSLARLANKLARLNPLDPADAVHVATAFVMKCPILLTTDGIDKKIRKRRKPLLPLNGRIVDPDNPSADALRIMTPSAYMAESWPLFKNGLADYDEKTSGSNP